jgi:hypothetical protein
VIILCSDYISEHNIITASIAARTYVSSFALDITMIPALCASTLTAAALRNSTNAAASWVRYKETIALANSKSIPWGGCWGKSHLSK